MLLLLSFACVARSPAPEPPAVPPAVAEPPAAAATSAVPLGFAQHAGRFDLSTGPWVSPGTQVEACDGGRSLVLSATPEAVRLGDTELFALGGSPVPADASAQVTAAVSAWLDATRARQVLCGEPGDPTLGLAFDPNLPWATARALLMGVGMAGVHRQAVLVAGTAGGALPEGEPPDDHLQVSAILGQGGAAYARPQAGRVDPVPGPWDVALPRLLGGGELGCAVIVAQDGLRFGDVVAELDGLASAGARRFTLADAGAPAAPMRGGTERPQERVALSGTVAAFLVQLPRFEPTPPDHELHSGSPHSGSPHSGSECSPVLYADRSP